MGVAAQVAYWGRRWPRTVAGPLSAAVVASGTPVTFPATQLTIRVELLLGGVWVDVSNRVLYEHRLAVERGRRPNQRRSTAATLRLTFRNADQRFSPRNPAGPYFGLLRQNTPIRVYVNPGSGDNLRFTGKIPSWKPKMRGHPNDRNVPVIAYGVRNRLTRPDQPPLQSAQARYLGSIDTLRYRSLETDAAPGRTPGPPGSGDLPDLARGGVFSDTIPGAVSIGAFSWAVECDVKFPLGNAVVGTDATALTWHSTGTVGAWRLVDDSSGVGLIYYTTATGAATTVRSAVNGYDGLWHHYRIEAVQNGTGIDVDLIQDGVAILSTTLAASILGGNTFYLVQDTNPSGGAARMPAVGQVVFHIDNTRGSDSYAAFTGWANETPADRFLRLCLEEGLDAVVDELITDQVLMGPQGRRTLPQLLEDCEDAAEGIIDETVDNRLRLSTLRSRYNREVALTLDYAAGDILPPFEPADDDEQLRNRWTLTRPDGGEATFSRTVGPNNINDPEDDPLGVGLYSDSAAVALSNDEALYVTAGWRVHRDTVDEPRYPSVRFELAANPGLIPGWLRCDSGSRVLIASGPDDVGPDDPDEILEGYVETFDQASWDVDAHLEPASVYRVATVSSSTAFAPETPRLDCGGSTLAAALNASDSAFTVNITDNCVWTHAYGDYPVVVDGEDMLLTSAAAAGGAYPAQTQVLSVQRGYNGTAITHAAGAEVHVKNPIILAR